MTRAEFPDMNNLQLIIVLLYFIDCLSPGAASLDMDSFQTQTVSGLLALYWHFTPGKSTHVLSFEMTSLPFPVLYLDLMWWYTL